MARPTGAIIESEEGFDVTQEVGGYEHVLCSVVPLQWQPARYQPGDLTLGRYAHILRADVCVDVEAGDTLTTRFFWYHDQSALIASGDIAGAKEGYTGTETDTVQHDGVPLGSMESDVGAPAQDYGVLCCNLYMGTGDGTGIFVGAWAMAVDEEDQTVDERAVTLVDRTNAGNMVYRAGEFADAFTMRWAAVHSLNQMTHRARHTSACPSYR